MLSKLNIVGIKTETTQGSAVALAATDFFQAYDLDAQVKTELLERNYGSTSLDPFSQVGGKKWQEIKFKADLKTSGAAGTPLAPLSALLQACGLTETAVGGVSVTYAPTSAAASANFYGPGKSATIKAYENGILKVLGGAMLNCKMTLEAGKIPMLDFSGKGTYAAVTDASFPTYTPNTTDPAIVKSATFSSHGTSLTISKLEIDLGSEIAERPDVNSANSIVGFQITGRKPSGSMDPEAALVATHDFYGKFAAGTLGQISIVIGSGAGNVITITLPKVQYGEIGKSDRNGIYTFNVPLIISRNSGDDFISIAIT